MSAPSTIDGGCLCGAVRYRAIDQPVALALCHCRSCQLASGAQSVAWAVFRASGFAFLAAAPTRFNSSPSVERTFCGKCGTSLTYRHASRPDSIDVMTATLDTPDAFAPTKEIWVEDKISWECVNETLPQYPKSSVGS